MKRRTIVSILLTAIVTLMVISQNVIVVDANFTDFQVQIAGNSQQRRQQQQQQQEMMRIVGFALLGISVVAIGTKLGNSGLKSEKSLSEAEVGTIPVE